MSIRCRASSEEGLSCAGASSRDWVLEGNALRGEGVVMTVNTEGETVAPVMGTTLESRYYQHQEQVPLLSVSLRNPGQIISRICF